MQTPAQSEVEMNAPALTETITLSVPVTQSGQVTTSGPAVQAQRQQGQVRILQAGDFGGGAVAVDGHPARLGAAGARAKARTAGDYLPHRIDALRHIWERLRAANAESIPDLHAMNAAFATMKARAGMRGASGNRQGRGAFTLAEVMIGMAGSVIVIGALLFGAFGLQRSLHASELYASYQANQRRILDYLRGIYGARSASRPPPR